MNEIRIKGARVHNLKNIDLTIPRDKLVVITGLSGSGKSSLAFDTLYAEGQRRYVESLSSYARQFLGKLDKPDVDIIEGISPAVAIEQKVISRNSRSTVGTSTEIYDYLKLLFARIGKTISPVSGKEVRRHSVTDVVDFTKKLEEGCRFIIYAPMYPKEGVSLEKHLEIILKQGFSRVRYKGEQKRIDELLQEKKLDASDMLLLIDRLSNKLGNEDNESRIADSAQTAFYEGNGECIIEVYHEKGTKEHVFSNKFELDGMDFEIPNLHFFSFNNPFGACKKCEGFGSVIGIDKDLVIPNKSKSVYDDAVVCWKGEKMRVWKEELMMHAHHFDFPIHKPYFDLSEGQKQLLWTGNEYFKGLNRFFKYIEEKSYKIQYRVMLSRYRGKTLCPACNGSRLRKDANYVKVGNASITELSNASVTFCLGFFNHLKLSALDVEIAGRILVEIKTRLLFLEDVGLGYLTLNRLSSTLSGGESQRINLATSLGSNLVGSMYILDEPSIGLHPRDTQRLIKVLKALRDLGNTVIVVEHEEEIMLAADEIIDIGPEAGYLGGEVVFQGDHDKILKEGNSLTAKYLTGKEKIELPTQRRQWKDAVEVKGARENNLKNLTVKFPLRVLTAVTGVSGSGKTSLIRTILFPVLSRNLGVYGNYVGEYDELVGDVESIKAIEFIDQNPIGKSSRSNPVTYVKAYDEIRGLFADQHLSKMNAYQPKHFSFNVEGGRCEVCEGEGIVKIEMQFMADVHLKCESCNGKRFKDEILEVRYLEKNISEILNLTVDEAIHFFDDDSVNYCKRIQRKLMPLKEVGLGYVKLGQASSTLSGGEAQRIKLASFLMKGAKEEHTLFIFDEPTTGLHFHDIKKLLDSLNALIKFGHSVIVIEHNAEIIKSADWVIDLGKEGGQAGGNLVFEGTPEELVTCKASYTGKYLKGKL